MRQSLSRQLTREFISSPDPPEAPKTHEFISSPDPTEAPEDSMAGLWDACRYRSSDVMDQNFTGL